MHFILYSFITRDKKYATRVQDKVAQPKRVFMLVYTAALLYFQDVNSLLFIFFLSKDGQSFLKTLLFSIINLQERFALWSVSFPLKLYSQNRCLLLYPQTKYC